MFAYIEFGKRTKDNRLGIIAIDNIRLEKGKYLGDFNTYTEFFKDGITVETFLKLKEGNIANLTKDSLIVKILSRGYVEGKKEKIESFGTHEINDIESLTKMLLKMFNSLSTTHE